MQDLASKIREATNIVSRSGRGANMFSGKEATDTQLDMVARMSNTVAMKERQGLVAGEVKAKLFNSLDVPTP